MATLATRRSVCIPGYESRPCSVCGAGLIVRQGSDPATCRACQRMPADLAVHEALGTMQALRTGAAPFDVLTPAERAEQILLLIGDVPAPALVIVSMKHLTAEKLISIVSESNDLVVMGAAAVELARRLPATFEPPACSSTPADPPDPDERQRIETDDELYQRELTLQRELDQQETPSPDSW